MNTTYEEKLGKNLRKVFRTAISHRIVTKNNVKIIKEICDVLTQTIINYARDRKAVNLYSLRPRDVAVTLLYTASVVAEQKYLKSKHRREQITQVELGEIFGLSPSTIRYDIRRIFGEMATADKENERIMVDYAAKLYENNLQMIRMNRDNRHIHLGGI